MNDEAQREFREVQEYFRLPSVSLVEKDFHVVRVLNVIAALDAAPFHLVFCGGTALARAHKLVRRMSEDVDFKVVQSAASPVSKSQLRKRLSILRNQVTDALQAGGFVFNARDPGHVRSRDENQYLVWQLPYGGGVTDQVLRPTIQVELTYAPLHQPSTPLPVSSFMAEAFKRSPEVAAIDCVSLAQTAAEKLVSLTRRTAMELAGVSRNPDPTLVRHVYDLHILRGHVDASMVAELARTVAATDAVQFRHQYPAYAADIDGETHKTLIAMQTDPVYRHRYDDFMGAMVYGERPDFAEAMATVVSLAELWII